MTSLGAEWITRDYYLRHVKKIVPCYPSIYHQIEWLDVVANGFGNEIKFARNFDEKGNTLALTPFMVNKKGPFRLIGTPLRGAHTEFSGPIFREGLEQIRKSEVLASLDKLVSLGNSYIEWGFSGDEAWHSILNQFGYKKSKRSTLLVDMSSGKDAIWSSFESRARNMIRKSRKEGVIVKVVCPDKNWIYEFFQLLQLTFERRGLAVPHPLSFYIQLISLSGSGIVRCYSALIGSDIVACSIFLVDNNRMLYFSGASNQVGMKSAASSLIQWHAIQDGIELGLKEYDMGGTGVPSIDKFKRSFGGKEFHHARWVRRSSLFKLVEPLAIFLAKKGWVKIHGS